MKKEEDAEEEERRGGDRLQGGELVIRRNSVQVTAMVERVVKRQADLGVDIVTDGEVAFVEGLQWNY